MGTEYLSPDAADRLGVFKTYADVPPAYRLDRLADEYDGVDLWATFTERETARHDSPTFARLHRQAGERWLAHTEARGVHHALATPTDVEAWVANCFAEGYADRSVYGWWKRVESFFDWLMWDAERSHHYNPATMAAHEYRDGATGRVWAKKVGGGKNRRAREVSDDAETLDGFAYQRLLGFAAHNGLSVPRGTTKVGVAERLADAGHTAAEVAAWVAETYGTGDDDGDDSAAVGDADGDVEVEA